MRRSVGQLSELSHPRNEKDGVGAGLLLGWGLTSQHSVLPPPHPQESAMAGSPRHLQQEASWACGNGECQADSCGIATAAVIRSAPRSSGIKD